MELCFGIDSSAGRINTSLLSDQVMLELLVESFRADCHHRFKFLDSFTDFRHWDIVKAFENETVLFLKLGPKGRADEIFSAVEKMIYGVFEAKFVPRRVQTLEITDCGFTGTVDFSSLPVSIALLTICRTPFEGSLDAKALPHDLRRLHIRETKLSGGIDFSALPRTLEQCTLVQCAFTGAVNLTSLPVNLSVLNLHANNFTGSVDLCHLPGELVELRLSENALGGSVSLRNLPKNIWTLDLGDNQLTGEISDEILSNLPEDMRYLGIHNNYFFGSIDLTLCSENIEVCVHKELPAHRKVDEMCNYGLEVTTWENSDFYAEE